VVFIAVLLVGLQGPQARYGPPAARSRGCGQLELNAFALRLKALSASTGMAFVFGEFGPGRDFGPSPTMLTPQQMIGASEAAGIGWMGRAGTATICRTGLPTTIGSV